MPFFLSWLAVIGLLVAIMIIDILMELGVGAVPLLAYAFWIASAYISMFSLIAFMTIFGEAFAEARKK